MEELGCISMWFNLADKNIAIRQYYNSLKGLASEETISNYVFVGGILKVTGKVLKLSFILLFSNG